MKTTYAIALLGATLASAQFTNQTKPFWLKFTPCTGGSGETYLSSCHSGAGQAGLCPETTEPVQEANRPTTHTNYFLNETQSDYKGHLLGALTWNQPIGNGDPVSSGMMLNLQIVSNGAIPIFSPGNTALFTLGFDENEKLFIYSREDDSKAVAGSQAPIVDEAYYRWHVCYTFVGNYYYRSLVWITAGPASNPTCAAVDVYREWA
ncbi:hypothetical protein BDP81DRAFT_427071 [Colletotrichum phormii]|uniref:DUF7907 domain-containing protein n=1 Tax=Colletotrichum phormii TaxID=359342 RepID=A0AAJ0EFR6_9PEZI|nr:uncharacterized protein BDP81DRAFT_427071 [Colletotrichum phormii]KAK1637269.1 hypothetical protein BDP81DRAFT_427071 [Colletotrichum phormii]